MLVTPVPWALPSVAKPNQGWSRHSPHAELTSATVGRRVAQSSASILGGSMSARVFFAAVAVTLSTLLVGAAAGAAETRREIQTVRDADYFGFDLRTEQNVTLDQCKTSCIGDKACKAFTYNPTAKWCFLK